MSTTLSGGMAQDMAYAANKRLAQSVGSKSGALFRQAASNTSQALTAASIVSDGKSAVAATVYCETKAVRVAIGGTDPTQGTEAVGIVLEPGDTFYLDCPEDVASFRFINAADGEIGILQVIPRF